VRGNTQCLWFPKGKLSWQAGGASWWTAQWYLQDKHFYFLPVLDFFAKGNLDTVLAEESRTQKRLRIFKDDDKVKNKNHQLSDNLSTFGNLWSRMAGSGI